jgi:hypothetical protein
MTTKFKKTELSPSSISVDVNKYCNQLMITSKVKRLAQRIPNRRSLSHKVLALSRYFQLWRTFQ